MAIRVAINGFGRIGRNILRAIVESKRKDIQIVAINDLGPVETNAHLLRLDSVHGHFPGEIKIGKDSLDCGTGPIRVTALRDALRGFKRGRERKGLAGPMPEAWLAAFFCEKQGLLHAWKTQNWLAYGGKVADFSFRCHCFWSGNPRVWRGLCRTVYGPAFFRTHWESRVTGPIRQRGPHHRQQRLSLWHDSLRRSVADWRWCSGSPRPSRQQRIGRGQCPIPSAARRAMAPIRSPSSISIAREISAARQTSAGRSIPVSLGSRRPSPVNCMDI